MTKKGLAIHQNLLHSLALGPDLAIPVHFQARQPLLGLSYAAGVVRAHGGRLTVRSRPGEGSTFTLCLPAEAKDVEPAAL
ncbi:MAG: hypothetical protein D6722_11760 [Bacteroidetes bacterium]|nr:MAG: hypothetical protein D6722_11760 [Bacteroidota bacterium]